MGASPTIFEDADYQITDEEYQSLIEQAIQQSRGGEGQSASRLDLPFHEPPTTSGSKPHGQATDAAPDYDADLKRAIAESQKASSEGADDPSAGDADLLAAIEASKAHHAEENSRKTEEDIVFEYMRKQSLAEDKWRQQAEQQRGEKRQSPAVQEDDEEDEHLKRALEESLRLHQSNGEGSSRW
jgi:hypothetical protein